MRVLKDIFFALLLLTMFAQSNHVFAQWSYLGLTGKPVTALSICSDTLYASTYDGIYKKNVYSTDTLWIACGMQGKHVVQTIVPNNNNFISVVEIDSSGTTQIYKSTDAGSSFILMNSDTSDHNNYQYLNHIAHPAENFDTLYFLNHRLKTFDGGITWDTMGNISIQVNRFIRVNPEYHSQLLIGGETFILSPFLQTSTDFGNNWIFLPNMYSFFPGDNCVHDIAINGNDWFGVGEGVISKSTDGSTTWNQLLNLWDYPAQWQLYIFAIKFSPADKSKIYATGAGRASNNNKVPLLYSADYGITWDTLSYNIYVAPQILSLAVMNTSYSDKVFLGGNGVYLFENNFTSVDDKKSIISNFALSQNYPNPFNPTTTIEYTIKKAGDVKIVVYDFLGREVKTIANEFKGAGSYKEVFNADNLSSGIYYYRLFYENKFQTKSMILLK